MKFLIFSKSETEDQYYGEFFYDHDDFDTDLNDNDNDSDNDQNDALFNKFEEEKRKKDLILNLKRFFDSNYTKTNVKKRKVLLNIKKGVTLTEKKNSIKRDKNNILIQQYLNVCSKTGNKNTLLKHFNIMLENFFMIFNEDFEEFQKHKNYAIINYLVNNVNSYSNFNFLLESSLINFQSVFDIKTKKNQKKQKLQRKFSHEIIYIPKQKRLKSMLKVISVYSENFKYYSYWERLF